MDLVCPYYHPPLAGWELLNEKETHHAVIDPRKNETATLVSTIMPDPNMAGDHSTAHPQLSAATAQDVLMPASTSQVKGCQSCLLVSDPL